MSSQADGDLQTTGTVMRSGELARLAGVSTKALRHYHQLGLLPEPHRSPNGYRSYPASAVSRLMLIQRLRAAGFSLRRIKQLLAADNPRGFVEDELEGLAASLDIEIQRLRDRRAAVEQLLHSPDPWDLLTAPGGSPDLFPMQPRDRIAAFDERLTDALRSVAWAPEDRRAIDEVLADSEVLSAVGILADRLVDALADGELDDLAAGSGFAPDEVEASAASVVGRLPPQVVEVLAEIVREQLRHAPLTDRERRVIETLVPGL